jgi:U2 small nuclear ribonucleoprotein B''
MSTQIAAATTKKRRSVSPERPTAMEVTEEKDTAQEDNEADEAPNATLFVENLPEQCNEMMLGMLFEQYEGYVEARLVAGKPGIAFVEFSDEVHSAHAKETLQGFKITGKNHMKITFARK